MVAGALKLTAPKGRRGTEVKKNKGWATLKKAKELRKLREGYG